MRTRFRSVILIAAAVLSIGSSAFAQTPGIVPVYGPSTEGHRAPKSMKAAAAAPKPSYDPKDFSGVWWGGVDNLLKVNPAPEMTPAGKAAFDANKPAGGPRGVAPALANDPVGNCDPSGYPRNLTYNIRSFEMVMLPQKIWQIFEWDRAAREIWLDGRKIPDDVDPRWYGYAVGRWDGNTLVVDSGAYNDKAWIDMLGDPRDENMTMQEKFTHPDALTLQEDMTITDPTIYKTPWVMSPKPMAFQLQLPKGVTELQEEYCVPSEEQFFNEHTRNPAAGISKTIEVK
jgi:hypothetical protein